MQGFDVPTILRTVGAAACARGIAYAERGAVKSIATSHKPGQAPKLVGTVQGSARSPYTVVVTSMPAYAGSPGAVFGACTCPMGEDCKHVAALMYAAGRTPAALRPARRSAWEEALQLGPSERTAPAGGSLLGLLVEPKHESFGRFSLSMRPVLRNERGRWVRTGVSWTDLTYGYANQRFPAASVRLLKEVYALHGAARSTYYYGSQNAALGLGTFPTGRIWDVLGEAAAASLPLICSADGTPVVLTAEPAMAGVDLTDVDGTWMLSPGFAVAGASIDAAVVLLGEPVHGIAWFPKVGRQDPLRPLPPGAPERVLHLARLGRPLDVGVRRLMDAPERIAIPAEDRPRFLRDYLPVLRGRLEITSADGSAAIPAREPGRLTLAVAHDRNHRLGLDWRWRYPIGGDVVDIPIRAGDRPELRDPDAERAAIAAALGAVQPMPVLQSWGVLGPELTAGVSLSGSDALRFAREVLPALRSLGSVDVEMAEGAVEFREAEQPPVVTVASAQPGSVRAGSPGSGTDWFDLTVTVTVDGEDVPFAELFRALATYEDYLILASGTYFALDRPELKQLRALIEESWALSDCDGQTLRLSRFQVGFWAELEALGVLDEQAAAWSAAVRELARCQEIPAPDLPEGLGATLRPYQQTGYTWLKFLYDNGLGGVLADDMGLGKTVQALALICKVREEKPGAAPFLVVAPTSVVQNWAAEARRFAPGLSVLAITETETRRGIPLDEACAGMDLVVTSYALFRLEYEDYERIGFSGLLIDEAQQIKNHASKGYQCARRLPAPFKLVITGTPMENNLMELWTMFSLCAPGLLGAPKPFGEYYRTPIEKGQDADKLAQLRRRIKPLLMRRTKGEVAADLPPKTEQVIELDLEPGHRRVYQRYLQRERRKVLGLLGDMDRHRFQIFRSLTLLRQAALDASLVDVEHARVPSTKLDALMEMLGSAAGDGHRVLVFSQFTRFLDLARQRLTAAGIAHCYLDGKTRDRGAVLAEFKDGAAPVFLISLKAGGVGLNLTEADYCILLDPWWNPATEEQAVDRAHRIGQDKPVMVYRLVAKDTIEDKVMALKTRKAALFASIMSDGGVGSAGLTAADIRGLLE